MNTQSLLNESAGYNKVMSKEAKKLSNKVGKDWPFRRYRV